MTTAVALNSDAGATQFYVDRNGSNVEFFDNHPTPENPAAPVAVVAYSDLGAVTITGASQSTSLTLDYSGGDLFPSGIEFDGQSVAYIAPNEITVTGDSGASYVLGTGTLSISDGVSISDSVTFSNVWAFDLTNSGGSNSIEISSGNFTFNSDLGASGASVGLLVDSGASASFGSTQHLNSLNVSSGATASMLPAGEQVLDTNTLTVNGTLDLANNDMIVNNPSSNTSMVNTLIEQVGQWVNANSSGGVIESSTAADDGMTIGIAPASSLTAIGGPTSLDGQTFNTSTALIARYVLPGDVNLDGVVSGIDYGVVAGHFNATPGVSPPKLALGDVNYDGTVNGVDTAAISDDYYGSDGPAPVDVTIGSAYTITLPTSTPTDGDPIERTDVNWGDGTNDSYAAGVTSASHVYTAVGFADLQTSAVYYNSSNGYGSYHAEAQSLVLSNTGVTATALSFTASSSTDVYTITANTSGGTIITKNGTVVEAEPTADILSLKITGAAASVTIDFTHADPLPASGIYTDAASVTLAGPHSTDPLVTTASAAYIGSDSIRYLSTTTLTDNLSSDGGIFALSGVTNLANPASDALTVTTGASVLINGSVTFSSLTIDAGATVRQTTTDTTLGDTVITVGSLTIESPDTDGNNGGVLDLGNGDLIAQQTYAGNIAVLLAAGYDAGRCDGLGTSAQTPAAIISSAASQDPYQIEALGSAQIGTDNSTGELNLSTFDGNSVHSGDTVVALTYYGDANLDRTIDNADYSMINSNSGSESPDAFGPPLDEWTNGDCDYNYQYDGIDQYLAGNAEGIRADVTAGIAPRIVIRLLALVFPRLGVNGVIHSTLEFLNNTGG